MLVLVLAAALAGCADRPPLIKGLTGLPVDATHIEVKLLDNPGLEAIDWWEVHYTTAHPKETVDTIRHFLIKAVSGAVDDANEGFGFTIGGDSPWHRRPGRAGPRRRGAGRLDGRRV
jgi:hypothetical protein